MDRLSLRLRVFLFFVLQGLGGTALVLGALWLGHARAAETSATDGFILAATVSAFGLVALTVGIWLLFDENVARPIEALSADLRARAHAGTGGRFDPKAARFLGDLGPAAQAVGDALAREAASAADRIGTETARLTAERERLTALLTEIPVAMILLGPTDRIVLYDGQAAEVLAQLGPPRLGAPMSDYVDPAPLVQARRRMARSGREERLTLTGHDGAVTLQARLRPVPGGGAMLTIDDEHLAAAPGAARPMVFDFDLLDRATPAAMEHAPLSELSYAVFDTETTGLLPHKDAVVQIGAVRVVNGRIVPGETIDLLVDPGRSIPPASTRVHRISNDVVAGQPRIAQAGRVFHAFARGSVIVAHNAPFDMAFLHREADAMGVTWDNPILDTVLLSAVLFGPAQVHTLDALCERLGVTIPDHLRHTAPGDAQATAEVLVRMIPMLEARGLTSFGKVVAQTRRHGRLLEDLN